MLDKDELTNIQSTTDRAPVSYRSHPIARPLARLANIFSAKTADIYNNSRDEVHEQLVAVLSKLRKGSNRSEKMRIVAEAHSTFERGRQLWLDSFVGLTQEYFHKLLRIAVAHPDWSINDPAEWARFRMLELLDKKFAPFSNGITMFDYWFRGACDGRQHEDTSTGYKEPWCAPVWSWNHFSIWWWEKNDFPDRLSENQTLKMIRGEASMWRARLPNELGDVADEAGVAFDVGKADGLLHPRGALDAQVQDTTESEKVVLRQKRNSPNRTTLVHQPEKEFWHSADYRSIRFGGIEHPLTRNQATIVRLLHEAYTSGTPVVGKELLLSAIESETGRVRDSFRRSPLWQTLIIASKKRRGTYQLNLD